MSKSKKYKRYRVRVINMDTLEVSYRDSKHVDNTNYMDMKELYKTVRGRHEGKNRRIAFLGVTAEGIQEVIWEKENKKELTPEEELLNKSYAELSEELNLILGVMKTKGEYHNDMISASDKKENITLHKIDTVNKKTDWDSEEECTAVKVALVDQLQYIRDTRREHKDEFGYYRELCRTVNLDKLTDIFRVKKKNDEKFKYKYLDENMVKKLKMFEEIKYFSHKDRVSKMKKLQNKYRKIVVDPIGKRLICYNKCKI